MSNSNDQANSAPSGRPLFRQQALVHLSTKQYGTVILARSFSFRFFTLFFVAIALGIICFFALFSTTRKAQTSGVLLPSAGVIKVVAVQGGVVVEKRALEGQVVKAGQVLYVLRSERQRSVFSAAPVGDATPVDAQKTISAMLEKRRDSFSVEIKQSGAQGQQKLAALQQRLIELRQEMQRADTQIALQQQRVHLAEQNLKRFKDLQATQFISAAQLQDRQAEWIDQQQRLAELQRVKASHQREVSNTESELRNAKIAMAREQVALQRSVAGVEQDLLENETRREFVVTAAQDGIVTAALAELGQTVAANQPLASILPEGSRLEAEIYAPSRAIGFVKPGMPVLLRYQAYPYQKFGQFHAIVREVASTSLRPDELALPGAASGANGEPVYRIRLSLAQQEVLAYGKTLPLKSGMLVDASILLEQRRLYEWVLEPLFSISGRM